MTDRSEEGLGLAEVKERFLQAERHLRDLAAAAEELQASSGRLDEAHDGLDEAAQKLTEYIGRLAEVTAQLAAATEAIQRTDPAEIRDRLGELTDAGAHHDRRLDRLGRWLVIAIGLNTLLILGVLLLVLR